MNKYFLIQKILEENSLTQPLEESPNEFETFFEVPQQKSFSQLYHERAKSISIFIDVLLEKLESVSGKELISLIRQRDYILNSLKSGERFANGTDFKNALELIFDVTHNHIKLYDEAEKLLTGERKVVVTLDGNQTFLNGKILEVTVKNNTVTADYCRQLVKKLNEKNCSPKRLDFLLDIYTEDEECECLTKKQVVYRVATDTMTIWQDRYPVYEDAGGTVTTDTVALADCYC